MKHTMLIQLSNQKGIRILYEWEELSLIKVLTGDIALDKTNLLDKYKGFITQ